MLIALVCFGLGYFVWLIDDWACGTLIKTRHAVGLPLAFLTELHGWYVECVLCKKDRLLIKT
jgi:dihydroceramidase